jgi:hypothetical protein
MGYIIPAGYSRLSFVYDAVSPMGSQIVWGLGVSSPPTEELLIAAAGWWEDTGKLRTCDRYTLDHIEARSDVEVLSTTLSIPGVLADNPAPPNTCALVKLGSGLVGKRNRGRVYLPGMLTDDDVNDSGGIDSAAVTSIQGTFEALGDALNVVLAATVILHSDVGTPTLVTTAQVQGVAATQRRRLRR